MPEANLSGVGTGSSIYVPRRQITRAKSLDLVDFSALKPSDHVQRIVRYGLQEISTVLDRSVAGVRPLKSRTFPWAKFDVPTYEVLFAVDLGPRDPGAVGISIVRKWIPDGGMTQPEGSEEWLPSGVNIVPGDTAKLWFDGDGPCTAVEFTDGAQFDFYRAGMGQASRDTSGFTYVGRVLEREAVAQMDDVVR